ncbi:MAG: alpha/beta fold hydrolase [Dehalococcoidia bacterium]|nr:alpha/beta fold hydrolase [Dehalococcoidia bacterium]
MPHVTISSGTQLYYERIGSGPPLLLIMGTGLDHSVWDAQVEAYRDEFECIVFDNAGTGKSGRPDDRLTVKSMAADTVGLLEALGVDRVHVSGVSLGSCIAQEVTLARPDMVASLQLHGTWARTDGYAGRKFRAQIRLIEMLEMRDFYEINVLWFITPEFFDAHPERVEAQIDAIVANAPSRESLIEQYQADIEHFTLDRLPQIEAPTLVTVGNWDVAVPPMYGREVAEAIPGAEFVMVDPGGHLHNMENPVKFNRVTLDFLRRVGGAA